MKEITKVIKKKIQDAVNKEGKNSNLSSKHLKRIQKIFVSRFFFANEKKIDELVRQYQGALKTLNAETRDDIIAKGYKQIDEKMAREGKIGSYSAKFNDKYIDKAIDDFKKK